MNLLQKMKEKARARKKTLVLPEGKDKRILKAAKIVAEDGLAQSIIILGNEADVKNLASAEGVNLSEAPNIKIIDPTSSPDKEKYAATLFELRKHKGMTLEKAREEITEPIRWGAMMVHLDEIDAMVAGADYSTADVLRAGLAIIGMAPGMKTASSNLILQSTDTSWGASGAFICSDAAVVPHPTAEQLADIAIASAQSCRDFFETEPAVALLSFSTRGSGGNDDPTIVKVREALALIKAREPGLLVDGELQLDSAIVPEVTDKKAPGSPVKGKTNVLNFPDINAGNIGIKLAQRFGKLDSYGPFLQGFAKPICDLSRGATVEEIANTCALTLAQVK